jgi:3'-5' exoribonuclease
VSRVLRANRARRARKPPDPSVCRAEINNRTVKTAYVADLQPNQSVTTFLLVQSKEIRFKRSGEPYLSLRLSDRSGQLDAKMWDGVADVASTFERDDVIKVQGMVQLFRDRLQMTVQKLRPAQEAEIEISDYLPRTRRNIDEMFAVVRETVERMQNPHLRQLLLAFLDDPEIAAKFKTAPAAKSLHHAFIGGLLEHVVSLLNLARLTAGNYDFIDLELLQTGVILHDMGKTEELTYERAFTYSNEGQLLGHIVIVLRMLDQKCRQIPDFPPRWKLLVEHMILSHHGKYEFGSPKLPMFPEAVMLNYLDDMDSKLESMRASLNDGSRSRGEWTAYNPSLERMLLQKERFLAGCPDEPLPEELPDAEYDDSAGAAQPGQAGAAAGRKPQPLSLFGERLQSALNKPKNGE